MNSSATATSGKKINFYASAELYNRTNQAAAELHSSLSEMIRKALEAYLERLATEKIEKELVEGYKANYAYDLKMNEEWKFADAG
jgi:metal-responsive CopG/Arc/MetJ family transcriptional regulator